MIASRRPGRSALAGAWCFAVPGLLFFHTPVGYRKTAARSALNLRPWGSLWDASES
jgi:hypothetical protein